MIPLMEIHNFAIQVVYPGWKTARVLFCLPSLKSPAPLYATSEPCCSEPSQNLGASKNPSTFPDIVQWLMYWIVFVVFSWLERNILFCLRDGLPLYQETKFLFFLWLAYADFQGAAWLWFVVLEKQFRWADDMLVDFLDSRMESVLAFALSDTRVTRSSPAAPKTPGTVAAQQANFLDARTASPEVAPMSRKSVIFDESSSTASATIPTTSGATQS